VSSKPDRLRHSAAAIARGFTLIEMIVVIVVIAVLAGLVGPMLFGNVTDARIQAARSQIELFGLALDAYRLDNDGYPTTEQGLAALRTIPTAEPLPARWRGPYVRKDVPADPWGHPYRYLAPGEANPTSYDLISFGRDGQPGGTGEDADLISWGANR
jgi:general secretion pathway protein G